MGFSILCKSAYTIIPIDCTLVVEIQNYWLERILLVNGIHDGFLSFGMSQTEGVTDFMDEDVWEVDAIGGGIIQDPFLGIVQMDVSIKRTRLLIVGIKRVRQNINLAPAKVEWEGVSMIS